MSKFVYRLRRDGCRRSKFYDKVFLVALIVLSLVIQGAQIWVKHILAVKS